MEIVTTVVILQSFLLLQATAQLTAQLNVSYPDCNYLGNFSMSDPWFTPLRPLPPPQSPCTINTGFYLYTRAQPARYDVTKLPDVSLTGSDFSGDKATFFITHGFVQDGNTSWLMDAKDALLKKFDVNVVIVDWGHGSKELNYLQAASNIRVAAADVIRLVNYLTSALGFSPSRSHMIGHSLGAQIFSYVGKAIPGVARITALDPAQPGFEGYVKEVRLDVTDANFVEVIHTDAIPAIGFGMVGAYGHVDYYVNGGFAQPGCVTLPNQITFDSLISLANVTVEAIGLIVACQHCRSYQYWIEGLQNPCIFWGHTPSTSFGLNKCDAASCSPMGLESINYPARGSFQVTTNYYSPYCAADSANSVMQPYRKQMDIVAY